MNPSLTVALIELILTYGPTAAIAIIKGLQKDNPTPDDIKALMVKDPSEYFSESDPA